MNDTNAISLAHQIIREPDDYPTPVFQAAVMLLLDPESHEMQASFLDVYDQASVVKNVLVSPALPYPPDAASYYEPGELLLPGVEIGVEPLGGWTLKVFPEQLRRHVVTVGMTGSGKTNLLRLIALGLGEIDK